MDTLEQAIDYLRFNKTPYWWVKSGNSKLADNTDESDINASIEQFREASKFWPAGSYKMEASRNPRDRTSGYTYTFTVGKTGQTPTVMQPISNNAYGISDTVLKQIQEEARRTLLFEQMADKFGPMAELVKDLDRRVNKIETFLKEDLDGDGIPDYVESISKLGDVAKAGNEMKKVFTGGLFS